MGICSQKPWCSVFPVPRSLSLSTFYFPFNFHLLRPKHKPWPKPLVSKCVKQPRWSMHLWPWSLQPSSCSTARGTSTIRPRTHSHGRKQKYPANSGANEVNSQLELTRMRLERDVLLQLLKKQIAGNARQIYKVGHDARLHVSSTIKETVLTRCLSYILYTRRKWLYPNWQGENKDGQCPKAYHFGCSITT